MTPRITVQTDSGGTHTDVDEAQLERLVEDLGSGTEFLILEREDRSESYAQACMTPAQLKKAEAYTVEFRDGPGDHWQGFTDQLSTVVAVLHGWGTGTTGWKDSVEWTKLDL